MLREHRWAEELGGHPLPGAKGTVCLGTHILASFPSSQKKDPDATGGGVVLRNKGGGLNLPCGLCRQLWGLGHKCSLPQFSPSKMSVLASWLGAIWDDLCCAPHQAACCQRAGSGVLQWGTLKLPSPMPSLALCLLSLTKSLSCLMTALINGFISGPACPSGGPKEGLWSWRRVLRLCGTPAGSAVGHGHRTEWPSGCHPSETAPRPARGSAPR